MARHRPTIPNMNTTLKSPERLNEADEDETKIGDHADDDAGGLGAVRSNIQPVKPSDQESASPPLMGCVGGCASHRLPTQTIAFSGTHGDMCQQPG